MKELVGIRLRDIRKNNWLSQDELANLSKLDRTYISRVESGKQNNTIGSLNIICRCLGVLLNCSFDYKEYDKWR